ncbi:septal ring lytic transglycosylase RlpA family protein [Pedobacter sp. SL55]|uniref:septal ring lytic transglycosylase RlpA family protein n=1 Tax=Pedobacter sp. SL55 TaxID=2995161 RepID=UPI00226D633E|nr:septal ring lytic transglycosylase RlpA family protein [Pedobacter sp. SL55]WAC40430.1 septal ring lytic transglycosylase RlpA family protein [Pedobacter sp. SL55]
MDIQKTYNLYLMRNTLLLVAIALLFACSPKTSQTGKASYYADKFNGRKTASGVTFRNSKKIAAHKTLPFGTKVKVTNLSNGKSTKVVIQDRGPFVAGRIIDLSKKSAKKIGLVNQGVGNVKIEYKKNR